MWFCLSQDPACRVIDKLIENELDRIAYIYFRSNANRYIVNNVTSIYMHMQLYKYIVAHVTRSSACTANCKRYVLTVIGCYIAITLVHT